MRIITFALALMATTTDALVGLGVDLGTSGVRVCVVERGSKGVSILSEGATRWTDDEGREPAVWLRALRETIAKCDDAAVARVGRVAVSGTSASTLLVDGSTGAVRRPPMMYSDAGGGDAGAAALGAIDAHAPPGHTCRGATSALAKLLAWAADAPLGAQDVAAHQADYVAAALCAGVDGDQLAAPPALRSDWHNALKMGFDVVELRWPAWLLEGAMPAVGAAPAALERLGVLRPGVADERRAVSEAAAAHWRLPAGAAVVGGTTDSIAAFLACSCDAAAGVVRVEPGRAVTSLGSTTALKLVSDVKIDDAATGVYSHRLDPRGTRIFNPTSICAHATAVTELFHRASRTRRERSIRPKISRIDVESTERESSEVWSAAPSSPFDFGTGLDDAWLVGGASNAGCKVLRDFDFADDELAALSLTLDAARTNDAGIYPLSRAGERFPFNDPAKPPKLPGGDDREAALHDLLVGIADVERLGYAALADRGATPLRSVQTAGGGAKNPQWRALREAMLGVPVVGAENTDAAFGAALLALREA